MIMYTAMPLELVFANMEQVEKQQMRELDMGGGVKMVVEPTGPFEGKVLRLISPNPQDYLNPRFAPGQIVSFHPQFS